MGAGRGEGGGGGKGGKGQGEGAGQRARTAIAVVPDDEGAVLVQRDEVVAKDKELSHRGAVARERAVL